RPGERHQARLLATRAAVLVQSWGRISCLFRRQDRWIVLQRADPDHEAVNNFTAAGEEGFLGFGGDHPHPNVGVLALANGDGSWLVVDGEGEVALTPPSSARVVGVTGQ